MAIQVELTYEMSRVLGERRLAIESASTVADVVAQTRARFDEIGADYGKLARVTAIAVNGVLVNHKKGLKTKLADGDRVGFVKAAAGG
ncbi:MAG TPA: MoaD/ThiS family protein [Deltaproteobacteria bacterium]|nr:MoaD/ThiS family protein [Deltaproteobacteria bacterium]